MSAHVVSIFPVNVTPTEEDPRTMGWRFACTCMRRRSRNYLIWLDREKAERAAHGHLELFGAALADSDRRAGEVA